MVAKRALLLTVAGWMLFANLVSADCCYPNNIDVCTELTEKDTCSSRTVCAICLQRYIVRKKHTISGKKGGLFVADWH